MGYILASTKMGMLGTLESLSGKWFHAISMLVAVQFLCSYITLPLYALVTQMGSTMKRSIFDEQTSKALKQWHMKAVKKKDEPTQTKTLGGSPGSSPHSSSVPVNTTGPSIHSSDVEADTAGQPTSNRERGSGTREQHGNNDRDSFSNIDLLSGP
ncbi:Mlo-like protein [Thalictrum thalictroides]|uniref:Mlo-like protein n=1 Tax=Thalictrum thalictroides TaxID=46969 RepID=A0A7J6WRD4_THATH|nr:Mlo-like protein [Thalictrum thalictroides]